MSSLHTRNLKDDVTHWTTSEARFAGYTFGTPQVLKGRWEDKQELFRTPQGEEIVSRAVVYLESDVDIGDYIALGDQDGVVDPTALAGAYRVMQFSKVSNLRNISMIRKAFI